RPRRRPHLAGRVTSGPAGAVPSLAALIALSRNASGPRSRGPRASARNRSQPAHIFSRCRRRDKRYARRLIGVSRPSRPMPSLEIREFEAHALVRALVEAKFHGTDVQDPDILTS